MTQESLVEAVYAHAPPVQSATLLHASSGLEPYSHSSPSFGHMDPVGGAAIGHVSLAPEAPEPPPDDPDRDPLAEPLETPLAEPVEAPLAEPLDTPLAEPLDEPVPPLEEPLSPVPLEPPEPLAPVPLEAPLPDPVAPPPPSGPSPVVNALPPHWRSARLNVARTHLDRRRLAMGRPCSKSTHRAARLAADRGAFQARLRCGEPAVCHDAIFASWCRLARATAAWSRAYCESADRRSAYIAAYSGRCPRQCAVHPPDRSRQGRMPHLRPPIARRPPP